MVSLGKLSSVSPSAPEPCSPITLLCPCCRALVETLALDSMWALEGAKEEVEKIFNETGKGREMQLEAALARAVEAPHILWPCHYMGTEGNTVGFFKGWSDSVPANPSCFQECLGC